MKRQYAVGSLLSAALLVLAGCSTTPGDRSATEDIAGVGDDSSAITLECTEKQVALGVPVGTTAISIEAVGAAGSYKSSKAEDQDAGFGGSVVGTYDYQNSDGNTLYAKVGCRGEDDGGYPDGGNGIKSANGGGGGSTGLYRDESGGDATNPIVIAAGGGGASEDGTAGGSGNAGSNGSGGDGVGNGKSCGGGGGQNKATDGAGTAKSYNANWGNPWPGKNGEKARGADAPEGNTGGGMGGAGGGGYWGGASGCSAAFWCDDCFGSGGAGSSFTDPEIDSPSFAVTSKPGDGSLGLTFLCANSSGDPTECTKQPTPSSKRPS